MTDRRTDLRTRCRSKYALCISASRSKNSDALQACHSYRHHVLLFMMSMVIQCCGTGVPSGVVEKLPSTVTKDAGRLVGCSKCLDRKQKSTCDRWLWLSVVLSACIYFSPFLSHSFNSNWTVTVYSFVVYTYLIVLINCIGFDHTLFIILYSAIQLFLLQVCQ